MKRKILVGTCLVLNLISLCSCNKNKLGNEIDNYNGKVFYSIGLKAIIGFENEYAYVKSYGTYSRQFAFWYEEKEYGDMHYYYRDVNSPTQTRFMWFKDKNTIVSNFDVSSIPVEQIFVLDTDNIYTVNDCKKVI